MAFSAQSTAVTIAPFRANSLEYPPSPQPKSNTILPETFPSCIKVNGIIKCILCGLVCASPIHSSVISILPQDSVELSSFIEATPKNHMIYPYLATNYCLSTRYRQLYDASFTLSKDKKYLVDYRFRANLIDFKIYAFREEINILKQNFAYAII